jgi:hypothetical protein
MGPVRRLALVAVFAVACGATAAHAQTLALAYHAGDVHRYSFHSTATENIDTGATTIPVTIDMSAQETVTVQSVDSSGVADLSVALSSIVVKGQADGVTNSTTGLTLPPQEIKIAADGRLLSVNGISSEGGFPFGMGTGGDLVSAVLPDTPVKPGDTWSKDYDQANPLGSGPIHVTSKSKYLRDESLQGVNAAVVETTSNAAVDFTIDTSALALPTSGTAGPSTFPLPQTGMQGITIKGTTTSDVTTWIDPNGHRILKSHMTSKTTANLSFVLAPGSALPGLIGPMSIQGSATVDVLPA